jgi:ubiquinone/menaquinone biosynthesis C-methylase UbiE
MWNPKRRKWESQYLLTQRSPEYMESVARDIASFQLNAAGCDVLDIGCGPGIHIHHFLAHKPRRIVGFDISPYYMSKVRELEAGAQFAQGSAERLPFRDESFDLVLMLGTLLHVRAPLALGEVRRVLRPGGRVWVSHMLAPYYWWKIRYRNGRPLRTYAVETLSSVKRLLEPVLGLSARTTYVSRNGFHRLLEPLAVEKEVIARACGLSCQIVIVARKPAA